MEEVEKWKKWKYLTFEVGGKYNKLSRRAIDLRDAGIAIDAALLREAKELASIFAVAIGTARANTQRMRKLPKS